LVRTDGISSSTWTPAKRTSAPHRLDEIPAEDVHPHRRESTLSNIQAEDEILAGLDFVEPQSGCLGVRHPQSGC
jgi:hypothetical protein